LEGSGFGFADAPFLHLHGTGEENQEKPKADIK
jgi:hypothetical protein